MMAVPVFAWGILECACLCVCVCGEKRRVEEWRADFRSTENVAFP